VACRFGAGTRYTALAPQDVVVHLTRACRFWRQLCRLLTFTVPTNEEDVAAPDEKPCPDEKRFGNTAMQSAIYISRMPETCDARPDQPSCAVAFLPCTKKSPRCIGSLNQASDVLFLRCGQTSDPEGRVSSITSEPPTARGISEVCEPVTVLGNVHGRTAFDASEPPSSSNSA